MPQKKYHFDSRLRVLIADDQPLMRDMLRAILKDFGIADVVSAETGSQAIEKINVSGADLIVCDWNMPDGTGLDVLNEVRRQPRFADLPFIMLTAEAYRERVIEACSAGVTDYIIKPFTADGLGEKVNRALKREKKK